MRRGSLPLFGTPSYRGRPGSSSHSSPSKAAGAFFSLLDVVAPPACLECGIRLPGIVSGHRSPFCLSCLRDLPWWRPVDGCPRCGTRRWPEPDSWADWNCAGGSSPEGPHATHRSLPAARGCTGCLSRGSPLHACHSLLRYEGSIRRWVPGFKRPISSTRIFGPPTKISRALETLAACLAGELQNDIAAEIDLVVSLPLHASRRRQRGFNHVDPIARQFASGLDLPWHPNTLKRIRKTEPQASLPQNARAENLRGAFSCTRQFDRNVRIALVDDVLTTGSTLEAAAEALLTAGALEVRGITLAATLPPRARLA